MDKETRNRIQRATQQARTLLEEDYERQLDGTYDIPRTGRVADTPGAHLEPWQVPIRQKLVAAVRHRQATGCRPAEAVAGCLREAAFTTLNRFVALKMLEARGLVQEALSKGEQSSGFREFTGLAPGLSGLPDHGYRLYLESLFDEIGQEVKVLFDRWDPASLLWPGHQAFQALLEILNQTDLAEVWKEDETIGWVYQYFNSDDERKKMRKESQAPRNSRELAVRNQFFTPRYVVEFLTDNTLGRTWYEMRQGETSLVDRCQYLVRRRRPVFLKDGEVGPEPFQVPKDRPDPGKTEAALWTRPNPDLEEPGDIYWYAMTLAGPEWAEKVLGRDCAELFNEKEEAWSETGKWDGTFEELRCSLFRLLRQEDRFGAPDPHEWPLDKIRSLYQEVCRRWDLETEHIPFRAKKDPRDLKILDPACGSGHFLLYCFDLLIPIYEESWADESSPASEVTGRALRQDYAVLADLRAAIPGLVLRHNLHGIDIDPRAAQIAALALWMRAQRAFGDFDLARSARPMIRRTNIVVAEPMPGEPELRVEFLATLDRPLAGLVEKVFEKMELAGEAGSLLRVEEDIRDAARTLYGEHGDLFRESDEERWHEAEAALLAALRKYAHRASDDAAYRRRLFAEDAARGFAFIDLMRQRYDMVLMNPPFGDSTGMTYDILSRLYPRTRLDLFASFCERGLQALNSNGRLGIFSPRDGFFKKTLTGWREIILRHRLECIVDLGLGVLDGATVRTAAYTVHAAAPSDPIDYRLGKAAFFSAVDIPNTEREIVVRRKIQALDREEVTLRSPLWFEKMPLKRFLYGLPESVASLFSGLPRVENIACTPRYGLTTLDDFRFCRLAWEVPPDEVGLERSWVFLSKGGEERPWGGVSPWLVLWKEHGKEMAEINFQSNGQTAQTRRAQSYYFRPAITFPNRSVRFSVRWMPSNFAFSVRGPAIIPLKAPILYVLGMFGSNLFRFLIETQTASDTYTSGVLKDLPWIEPDESNDRAVQDSALSLFNAARDLCSTDETDPFFVSPLATEQSADYETWKTAQFSRRRTLRQTIRHHEAKINEAICSIYGVSTSTIDQLLSTDADDNPTEIEREELSDLPTVDNFLSFLMGRAMGRFSIGPHASNTRPLPSITDGAPSSPPGTDICVRASILADDSGHDHDLVEAIIRDICVIFSSSPTDSMNSIAQELARDTDPQTSLRRWCAHKAFSLHLSLYSRTGRRAPIYWQLATPSASYSVWLYYHRLTRDTFYQVLNDFVVPKLRHEEAKLTELRQDAGPSPTTRQRKEIDDQETFVEELRAYREEVERVAPLWSPNLNDGVIINFAPLWRLVPQHREWQKECRECWNKLAAGDYDWAHLAIHLWPERVVPRCATDRSLAIAHDLEEVFWQEGTDGKWRPKPASPETLARLVAERTSPSVRDARDKLLAAPEPVGRRGGRRAASTPRTPRAPRAPRPTAPEPTTDPTPRARATANPQAREAILRHLATTPTGAAKADLLAATALDESTWKPTIDELLATNQVTRTGEKRGTRYHLASNG